MRGRLPTGATAKKALFVDLSLLQVHVESERSGNGSNSMRDM